MTTQAQGKGKKKNKESMKVSLDEFNQIDAPHGHSVVSVKVTGLDWAETMADHDQQAVETQQIIVPAAPRAQRGPGIDIDSLSDDPPFRVSVFGLPMTTEEKDITDRFFQNLNVKRVEISKSSTTVEFESKNDLYEALCKDGSSIRGRPVSVCVFGETPQNNYSDRYGGRGGNSSYGDRYGDRNQGGFGGQRSGERYGDRSGGFNRDRESYTGFNRGGFGQQKAGGAYGDRYYDRNDFKSQYTSGGGEPESSEPENWRARPTVKPPVPSTPTSFDNGSKQLHAHSRPEPSQHYQQQYQKPVHYQPRNQNQSNILPNSQFNNQASSNNNQSSLSEQRPKLVLTKRKTPLNLDDVSVSRNEAIFGQAKPTSTPYQKMKEVEDKLKSV